MKIHDLYKKITNEVIAELENGTVPWHRPWGTAGGTLGDTALPVRHNGENILRHKPTDPLVRSRETRV